MAAAIAAGRLPKQIKWLDLPGCNISNEGAEALAEARTEAALLRQRLGEMGTAAEAAAEAAEKSTATSEAAVQAADAAVKAKAEAEARSVRAMAEARRTLK